MVLVASRAKRLIDGSGASKRSLRQGGSKLYYRITLCYVTLASQSVAALGKNTRVGFSPQYGKRGSASL